MKASRGESKGAIGLVISAAACVLAPAACGTRTGLDAAPSPCRWSIDEPHVVALDGEYWDLQRMYVDGDRVLVRAGSPLGSGDHPTQVFAVGFDGRPLGGPWLEGPFDAEVGFGHAAVIVPAVPYSDPGADGASSWFVPTDEHGAARGARRRLRGDSGDDPTWLRATPEGFTYFAWDSRGGDPELVRLDATGKELARGSLGLSEWTISDRVDLDDGDFMLFMDRPTDSDMTGPPWATQRFSWDGRLEATIQIVKQSDVFGVISAARFGDSAVFLSGTPPMPIDFGVFLREMTTQAIALDGSGSPTGPSAVFSSHVPMAARQLASGELVVVTAGLVDLKGVAAAPSQVHVLSSTLSPLAKLDIVRGPHFFATVEIAATPEGALVAYPSDVGIAVAALRCR